MTVGTWLILGIGSGTGTIRQSGGTLNGAFTPENVTIVADHPLRYTLEQTSRGLTLNCNAGVVVIFR